jgi:hypothetical protein
MSQFDDLRFDEKINPNGDMPPGVDPSFWPIDLAPVVAGNYAQPIPSILHRNDEQALIYPGEVNGIHGSSGEGKGWVELFAAVEQMRRGHNIILLDLEDNAPSIVARLRLLGATDNEIVNQFIYVRPTCPFGLVEIEHVIILVTEHQPTLVIIDSLGEAFGLDGIDENSDAEVGPWLRRVARRLAELGPAIWLTDHSTKANDNPLFPSGSKRKRAAITGASYLITATVPLAAGKGGRLRITCAKDRHGTYARGEHVADFVMQPSQGGIAVNLWPGSGPEHERGAVGELAARSAVKAADELGQPVSRQVLIDAMKIKAGTDTKRGGIDLAVLEGWLIETTGPRNARLYAINPVDNSNEPDLA